MGRGKHCSVQLREQIKALRKRKFSYRQIFEILNCSKRMVENAVKYTPHKETRGRKTKISSSLENNIVRFVKKNPFATSTNIKSEFSLNVDTSTIRKRLIKKNLKSKRPRKVPLLSKNNITKRLFFANKHINWSVQKWRNILWSDESKFNMFYPDCGSQHVRRPVNTTFKPQYTIKTIKHGGGSIMVWGCFSYQGVGPVYRIEEKMTAATYCTILNEVMLPYTEDNMPLRWVFQQDNDPKHTSKLTKKWFTNNKINILDWPSQSPDLNPIENLWQHVKVALRGEKATNKDQLWSIIKEAWESIPQATCQKLVDSMPRRCMAVIQSKGCATKY